MLVSLPETEVPSWAPAGLGVGAGLPWPQVTLYRGKGAGMQGAHGRRQAGACSPQPGPRPQRQAYHRGPETHGRHVINICE